MAVIEENRQLILNVFKQVKSTDLYEINHHSSSDILGEFDITVHINDKDTLKLEANGSSFIEEDDNYDVREGLMEEYSVLSPAQISGLCDENNIDYDNKTFNEVFSIVAKAYSNMYLSIINQIISILESQGLDYNKCLRMTFLFDDKN